MYSNLLEINYQCIFILNNETYTQMKKIKNIFTGLLGILIAIVLLPIGVPVVVYKSIINSKIKIG